MTARQPPEEPTRPIPPARPICVRSGMPPRAVRAEPARLAAFQAELTKTGVELRGPTVHAY